MADIRSVLLRELQEGIAHRTGVTLVIGESALERAELCRALAEQVREDAFTAVVQDTLHSEGELLAQVLRDFGVVSRDQSRVDHRVDMAHSELLEALERFLRGLIPIDATALLLVDNSQGLPRPVLLRLAQLAVLESNGLPLLQMVVMGTSELDELLRNPELAALDARVHRRYTLPKPVRESEDEASMSWLRHPPTLAVAIAVVLLGCVLAVTLGIALYRRLGF